MGLLAFTNKHLSPEMHAAPKIAKFCNFVIFVEFAVLVKFFFCCSCNEILVPCCVTKIAKFCTFHSFC